MIREPRVEVGAASARAAPRLAAVLLAGALAGWVAPARGQEAPAPPLNIGADNVTGSHGPEGDVVLLNGNVRITRGRTLITADRGRYLRAQGMLYLDEHVRLVDSTTTLTCDHASYSEEQDLLEVSGNVVVVDREAVLKAPSGTYSRRTGRADLYGGVKAEDKTQRISCEQVTYWRDRQVIEARGQVIGLDTESRLELRAKRIDYDRGSTEALATGDPVLESRDDRGHSTFLWADTLKLNSESRVAEAIDSVRVLRDTLQARADYALFDDRADRGWLLGRPRAWDNETTVSGDTLEVWTEKRALRRFVVRGNAVMDYRGARPATLGELNRLSGRRVDVLFTDEAIDSLVATGEARNDYQAVARPGKTNESNTAEGDTITVFFRDKKIARARVQGKARGDYRFAVTVGDTAAARAEMVRYDAPRIEYEVAKSRFTLEPVAHLVYKELELRARRVEFSSENLTLVASGDPQLVERGDKVEGHLMTYDLESRTGTIYQAETEYERGLYHGDRIRKGNTDELDVMHGSYSTCENASPHYHFSAKYMKIYLKDKVVAKPVVFYVKNVPILALPFYLFPIKPGRHSGFLFPQLEFGYSNQSGQFIRNAGYYWAPNDYIDFTVAADYFQAEPSWVLRGETVYKLLYKLDGHLGGSYAKSELDESERWDITADHAQELTPRTRGIGRISYVSNRDYRRSSDFGNTLAHRLDRFLTSSLSLSHLADWANLTGYVDRREDLDADESIKDPDGQGPLQGPAPGTAASLPNLTGSMPSLSVIFPTRTIGTMPFLRDTGFRRWLSSMYFSLSATALVYRERRGVVSGYSYFVRDSSTIDSTTVIGEIDSTRKAAQALVRLSDNRRLFGWLNMQAGVNANGAVFDEDNLGNKVVPTGTWSLSAGSSATFYGSFKPRLGALQGLRHVLFPVASYTYSPEFPNLNYVDAAGITRNRFTGFGGIGVSGFKSSFMSFGLEQRLQAKLRHGEEVRNLDNLLSWTVNGTYDFLAKERGNPRPLSPLGSSFRLQPPGYVNADLSFTYDAYEPRPIRQLGYNVGFTLRGSDIRPSNTPDLPLERPRLVTSEDFVSDTWILGMAYSYAGGYTEGDHWSRAQTANGVLQLNVTPAWHVEYSTSYDVTNRILSTQRFGITRDLHCWQASFSRIFTVGGEAEYYFRINVKQQRELYLERGTRSGSIGGIQ